MKTNKKNSSEVPSPLNVSSLDCQPPKSASPKNNNSTDISQSLSKEGSYKKIIKYQQENRRLHKLYEDIASKTVEYVTEIKRLREKEGTQTRELWHAKRALEIAKQAKAEADESVKDSKELVHRLLAKLARAGTTGDKHNNSTLTNGTSSDIQLPANELVTKCALLEHELSEAQRQISILTRALAIKGEQLGLEHDGDLKSVLLYDLARSSEEALLLGLDLAKKSDSIKSLQKTVAELSFVRANNNEALIQCERKILELEEQNSNLQKQLTAAIAGQGSLLQVRRHINELLATQDTLEERLLAAQRRATDAEQAHSSLMSAYLQNEAKLATQTKAHAATLLLVEQLQAEVAQLRERERTAAVHEAVGASINSMRTQLSDARTMYSRIESENTALAQENSRLLSLNAELRAKCEQLQIANNNPSAAFAGGEPIRSSSPLFIKRSHSPKIATRNSFTFVPSPLSSPILASPFEAPFNAQTSK